MRYRKNGGSEEFAVPTSVRQAVSPNRFQWLRTIEVRIMVKNEFAWSCLRRDIERYVQLADGEWMLLQQLGRIIKVARGDCLSRQGELVTRVGFLCSGHFKSVRINRDGKEAILSLYLPGAWVCDLESFLHGTTGRVALQAITDAVVICFDKQDEQTVLSKLPSVTKYLLRIHQNYIVLLQHKLSVMQYGSARQKYEYFLAMNYGELIPHLTQKQIAAYLGITPEFLSTQKNLVKKC